MARTSVQPPEHPASRNFVRVSKAAAPPHHRPAAVDTAGALPGHTVQPSGPTAVHTTMRDSVGGSSLCDGGISGTGPGLAVVVAAAAAAAAIVVVVVEVVLIVILLAAVVAGSVIMVVMVQLVFSCSCSSGRVVVMRVVMAEIAVKRALMRIHSERWCYCGKQRPVSPKRNSRMSMYRDV
jgi:hypothetical protein